MDILLKNDAQTPIYLQIVEQIKECIINGELQPGDALPSIRNLAKSLKVSVITTKRAFSELEHDNFVYTTVGKGTFVAEQNLDFVRENRLKRIESQIVKAIETARSIQLEKKELLEILDLLWEEI